MTYARTAAQRAGDRVAGATIEEMVGDWLGDMRVSFTQSVDKLDHWVPGYFLEVKGKYQRLSKRWPQPWPEEDCFILDELSFRRAMEHYPAAFFCLYDKPCDRWFFARVDEVALGDKVRLNRTGDTGVSKGKLVINLAQYRQLQDPESELHQAILADMVGMSWKQSACLAPVDPVKEVA